MRTKTSSMPSPVWRKARRLLIGFAVTVTLMALFYAEEDMRGRIVWAAAQREVAAQGIDLNSRAYEPAPVPDEQNFATTPFLAPLFDFNPEPIKPNESHWRDTNALQKTRDFANDFVKAQDSRRTDLDDPEHPALNLILLDEGFHKILKTSTLPVKTRAEAATDLLQYFEPYQPVLEEIRNASRRPYSRFNIEYDAQNPMGILLAHLAVVKKLAMVLSYRASAELALGRNDAAFADVQLMISLEECLHGEPFMISHLVRLAILQIASREIWEGLSTHAWSDQQLNALQSQLGKLSLLADSGRPLRYEIAAHSTRVIDFMKNQPSLAESELNMKGAAGPLRLIPAGWFDLERASYVRPAAYLVTADYDAQTGLIHPKKLDEASAQIYKELHGGGKRGWFSTLWHHSWIASYLIQEKSTFTQKSAFSQTTVNEAIIACAIERYRLANHELPGTLATLTPKYLETIPRDIITGEPLKYEPTGANQFLLYSVGWNETDDGGKNVFSDRNRSLTQGDWAWVQYP